MPEVKEKVIISLQRYERLKEQSKKGSTASQKEKEMRGHVARASKELGQLLNFLADNIDNVQELINAFNNASDYSNIVYNSEKERYYIELMKIEKEEDEGEKN